MQPVGQFDEALGDSMTPQSENTPREGERGDESASPPAESTRNRLINQHYKALSALLPSCSRKRDKACIVEEAIAYLKQLQERVNTLEEQVNNTSVIFRPQTCEETAIVKLEAIVAGKNVLIRIICVKQKGYLPKIVTEIEKLHLTIDSFDSLPFGNNLLTITISAQVDDEFYMTTSDLLRNLRLGMLEK
ncbi:transcription factor bHLH19-like [Actinidia eriantha]|uniref:transcription factor bHLH19-like n=1 Tax=Actinidia eriantha TaxID=165200 RepID=UPI0025881E11|nr:transcription factor bHLH19-like [Actinidia eriantha]